MSKKKSCDPKKMLVQDRHDFARLGAELMETLGDYLNELPQKAVDRVIPDDERQRLSILPLPDNGMSADEVISFMQQHILPWPQPTGHARSYGWVNSPPMPVSILAETVTQTMNSSLDGFDYSGLFLMVGLGNWLMKLTGFPKGDDSIALLFSGGSAATLNALTTARYRAALEDGWNIREDGLQGSRPAMTVYVSDQAHSSVQRCVEQLGLGTKHLRIISTDENFRMDVSALKAAIEKDKNAGLRPIAVVATTGTTNVGAIDPLGPIADVCEAEGVWLHVDGAYGGIGGLDPEYAVAYADIGRADSVTVDPHKWLQVSLDCGALLTRHKSLHRQTFTLTPDYLRKGDEHEVPWPYEYMFQLTYANRSIKTWAAIARLGLNGIRQLVVNCNALAKQLGDAVNAADDFELLAPTSLSIANFRYVPPGADPDDAKLDELNERISSDIAKSGEAHIPTTRVNGKVSLRVCFLHYENDADDIEHLLGLARKYGST